MSDEQSRIAQVGCEVYTSAIVHFDGGARLSDNGPAAIGYTVEIDGSTEEQDFVRIGTATCNEAEYHALIKGLEVTSNQGFTVVEAKGASQLIVKQVNDD